MKKLIIVLSGILSIVILTGCQVNRQTVGSVAGGIAGGAIGTQIGGGYGRTIAIIGGTLIGAAIGGAIGKSMDDVDRMKAQRAIADNRTGQASSWRNPDTGANYTVTPTRTYYQGQQPCREYQTKAVIGGKTENMYGKACREADGSWRQVS